MNNHGKSRKILIAFVMATIIIIATSVLAHELFDRQVAFLFDDATWINSFMLSWASVLGTTGDKIFDIENSYNFKIMCITQQTMIAALMLWAFY